MARNDSSTQEQLARLAKISQPRVSQLIAKGVLTRGGSLTQWISELLEHQRRLIAQHESSGGLDLIAERARLSARQAEKIEIEIAVKKGELLPVAAVAQALHHRNGALRSKLLALPSRYKSINPTLTPRQVDSLDNLVREILTELTHEQLPAAISQSVEQYFSDLRPATETHGQRVGGPLSDLESGVER